MLKYIQLLLSIHTLNICLLNHLTYGDNIYGGINRRFRRREIIMPFERLGNLTSNKDLVDPCGQEIAHIMGEDQLKTRKLLEKFATVAGTSGHDACHTTEVFTSMLIERKLQRKSVPLQFSELEPLADEKFMLLNIVRDDFQQNSTERSQVIATLKKKMLRTFDDNKRWKPIIVNCYVCQTHLPMSIAHTFSIHRESRKTFRLWQSYVGQYDLFAWITQNIQDREISSVSNPSLYSGVMKSQQLEKFIDELATFSDGSIPWKQAAELHQNLFWAKASLNSKNNNEHFKFNLQCIYKTNYSPSASCTPAIQKLQRHFKE